MASIFDSDFSEQGQENVMGLDAALAVLDALLEQLGQNNPAITGIASAFQTLSSSLSPEKIKEFQKDFKDLSDNIKDPQFMTALENSVKKINTLLNNKEVLGSVLDLNKIDQTRLLNNPDTKNIKAIQNNVSLIGNLPGGWKAPAAAGLSSSVKQGLDAYKEIFQIIASGDDAYKLVLTLQKLEAVIDNIKARTEELIVKTRIMEGEYDALTPEQISSRYSAETASIRSKNRSRNADTRHRTSQEYMDYKTSEEMLNKNRNEAENIFYTTTHSFEVMGQQVDKTGIELEALIQTLREEAEYRKLANGDIDIKNQAERKRNQDYIDNADTYNKEKRTSAERKIRDNEVDKSLKKEERIERERAKIKEKELNNTMKEYKIEELKNKRYSALGDGLYESTKGFLRKYESLFNNKSGFSGALAKFFGNQNKNNSFGNFMPGIDPNTGKPYIDPDGNLLKTGVNLGTVFGGVLATGLEKLGKAAVQLGKDSVEAYENIQSLQTNLEVVYGDKTEANSVFNELASYATKSPFGVQSTTEFAIQLKQSGVYSSELLETLKMIGDTAGGNEEKMRRIANNYAQITANGKATTRDLREFATAGLPIYKELSKILGVSVAEIRSMTEEGKITSQVITRAFKNMTSEGGVFFEAVEKGAQTLKARKINLQDYRQLALAQSGEFLTSSDNKSNSTIYEDWLNFREDFWAGWKNFFEELNKKGIEKQIVLYQEVKKRGVKGNSEDEIPEYKNITDETKKMLLDALGINDDYVYEYQGSEYESVKKTQEESLKELEKVNKFLDILYKGEINPDYRAAYQYLQKQGYIDTSSDLDSSMPTLQDLYQFQETKKYRKLVKAANTNPNQDYESSFYINNLNKYSATAGDFIDKLKDSEQSSTEYAKVLKDLYKKTSEYTAEENKNQEKTIQNLERIYNQEKMYGVDSKFINTIGSTGFRDLRRGYESYKEIFDRDTVLTGAYDLSSNLDDSTYSEIKDKITNLLPLIELATTVDEYQSKESFDIVTELKSVLSKSNDKNFRLQLGKIVNNVSTNPFNDKNAGNKFVQTLVNVILSGVDFKTVDKQQLDAVINNVQKNLILPLWERTLQSAFNIDEAILKNNRNLSGIDILGIWNSAEQKTEIKTLLDSMISTGNHISDVLNNVVVDFETVGPDNVNQINWTETLSNLHNFALDMDTATSVTQAYINAKNQEKQKLDNFITTALTATETGANIYSEEYKKSYQEFANDLKILDFSAFDNLFEQLDDGSVRIQDGTIEMAISMSNMIEATNSVYSAFLNLKSLLEETNKKVIGQKYEEAAKTMVGKIPALAKLTEEDQIKSIAQLYEAVNTTLKESDYQDVSTLLNKTEDVISFVNDVIKGGIENIDIILSKYTGLYQTGELFDLQNGLQNGTTIPLNSRPRVSSETMLAAGYDNGGGHSTVFSSSYSNEKGNYHILVTPILPDGEVLTSESLDSYANEIINGSRNGNQIVLQRYGKGGQEVADADAQRLHETQQATDAVSDSMKDVASMIIEVLNSLGMVTSTSKSGNSKDIYPLWQRILNQNLGTDLTLFKKGAITNGRQAVELFDRQSQKEQIKNIARTMLDYNTTSFMSNLITRGNQTYTENNSRDGTRTINWTKTYQNFTDFARSMESATAVTQAYAQSLESETNSLKDLLSNSFTTMEDSANIFDENYQKMIGDTANSIKALDMNAYDNLFEEIRTSEGTFIKFRENAIEAANALLKEKEVTLTFVEAIGTFKSAIDDMTKQIANSTIEMQVYTGQYSKYKTLSGLDNENQIKALQFVSSALSTDKMNQYFNGKGFSREYVTKALLSGTSISISGNNDEELQNLKIRKSKLEESISGLLETAIDDTIKIENQKFEDKSGGDAWKKVYGNKDESEKLARKWVEEGVDSRAGKAYKTAKDELALITEQVDVLSNSSVNLFDELNESFVKYLEYLKQEKDIIESAANSKVFGELWNKDLTNTDDTLSFKSIYNTRQRDNVFGSNTIQEQQFIKENFNDETLQFNDVFKSVFKRGTEDYNEIVKEMLRNTTSEEYEGLSEIRQKLDKDFARTGTFDINNVKEFILALNDVQKAMKGIRNTFVDLGKTISDAFDTAILSGFTETAKQLGANLYEIKQNTFDSEAAAKSYQNVWKGIAAQMLESIGPAMTQAGLDLISLGARKDSWGTILAGAGLVTAGGVAQIGAGFLSAAQNDSSDNDDETQKLETLKELLSDIIDQAKIDAEYYQKNLLHKNAISMNERTSVNDAIITPSGDVITTHPDDYLIATKTPGSLASSSPNVSIKFIDQSQGGKVQIKETHQTRDANGNIEIKAIVVAAMNEAIANGDADVAFEARNMRLNGRSVIL